MPRRLLLSALGVLLGLALPFATSAQVPIFAVPPASMAPLCALTNLCGGSLPIGVQLFVTFLTQMVQVIRIVFVGFCTAYFAMFGLLMIVRGYEENTLTEQRKAFGYAAFGIGIVGISSLILQTFSPATTGGQLVNAAPLMSAADRIADYVTIATGGFLVFLIGFAGFRIIALQGDEGEIQKQKKSFFNGLLGIGILLLARIFVFAITGAGKAAAPIFIVEVAGIVRFLLEILAALSVVAFVVAGFFFIISFQNEQRATQAKRILTSTIIMLAIVVASHTLLSTFIR